MTTMAAMEESTAPEGPREGPEWLPDLLKGKYFIGCTKHAAAHKNERNFFCLHCMGESICAMCVAKDHMGDSHLTVQIRRSSYAECVRVADVRDFLDLSHIQVYVINSAKIVFLNARPQKVIMKGAPYVCESCARALLDPTRFCSIACKRAAIPEDFTLTLQPNNSHKLSVLAPEDSVDSEQSAAALKKRSVEMTWQKTLPPLVDDVSDDDGDSRHGGGGRKRRHMAKRLNDDFEWDLVSLPNSYGVIPPSTPPRGTAATNSSWPISVVASSTSRRKGVPHRAPFW